MVASVSSGRSRRPPVARAVILAACSAAAGTSTLTCAHRRRRPAPRLHGSLRALRSPKGNRRWPASTVNATERCCGHPLHLLSTSTTSTSRPEPIRAASRPAISLPSAVAAISRGRGLSQPGQRVDRQGDQVFVDKVGLGDVDLGGTSRKPVHQRRGRPGTSDDGGWFIRRGR